MEKLEKNIEEIITENLDDYNTSAVGRQIASEVKDMLKAYGEELEQLIRDGYNITDRDEHVADFITNYYK